MTVCFILFFLRDFMFFIDRLGGGSRVILLSHPPHLKQSAPAPAISFQGDIVSSVCPRAGSPSTGTRPGSPDLVSSRLVYTVSSESSAVHLL